MKFLLLLLLVGCAAQRERGYNEPFKPRFEKCEVVVTDGHGNRSCRSWRGVCRDLLNCGDL